MKKILFLFALLSVVKGFSQAITVNPNQTPAQLVNSVLVDNSCLVQISNIVTSTGSNFGSSNGIASYQNPNASFPVTGSGLLLTTGQATASPGPNTSVLSNGGASATWLGNAELQAALAAAGINITTKNATLFQFDFIPNSTTFGLDFLFASEEYGQFQCSSNDAFVVLLQNLDAATPAVNVALVPSTTDPITVSNIRNILYSSECDSENENYFGQFNGGSNAASAAINYNGQTKLMHVSGTLVPNAHYRIKFIIADDARATGTDGNYDSAVFIPAGSLNLGQQLFPTDFTVANGNPICFGQEYVLDTHLDPAIYDFEWKKGTTVLPETGPALTVEEPGTYSITLSRPDLGCVTTESVVIEYAPAIPAAQPNDLYKCENNSNSYQYDLASNTPVVKQGLDPNTIVTYHATQDNAINNVSPLSSPYTSPSGATIWVRVQSPNSNCYTLRTFQLLTSPPPTANAPGNMALCETTQGSNTAIFNLNQQDPLILGAQPVSENVITYYTSSIAANNGTPAIDSPASFSGTNQTIYARIEKAFDPGCFSITSFNLVVNPLPALPASETINACDSYTLPALTTGGYFTGIGGTGQQIPAGTALTSSQTVYIYAQSGGTPNCTNQSQLTINIITGATAPGDVTACQSYVLPALNPGEEYHTAPGGGGQILPAGTVITVTTTIYFFIPANAACTQNNSFVVTITNQPTITELADVTQCTPYTLPVLPNGQKYRTGPNGTGLVLMAGDPISTPQTIYIYANNPANPACTAQSDFVVNINIVDVPDYPDVVACNNYFLPALPSSQHYYTQPNGGGQQLNNGQNITSSQTIYVFGVGPTNSACTDQDSFTVTINPLPVLPVIQNVSACNSYTLPNPPANSQYYSAPDGGGDIIPGGTVITETQTIYAYSDPNQFGCRKQRAFTVTIINLQDIAMDDVTSCVSYTLPPLEVGNYYSAPNGAGAIIPAGTTLTTTQTVYIYATTNTTPACTVQDSFVLTIKDRPNMPSIADVVACTSYTLPAIAGVTNGTAAYYTGPNGTGTMLPVGTAITSTQTIYAYAQTGGTPNCTRSRTFNVTIIQNGTVAPGNVTSCGPYTLPALPVGNYYNAANGGGGQIPAGTVINTSRTVYAYAATTDGPNCTTDDSFTVTINPPLTADDPADVVTCVPYQLPVLTNGDYYTAAGGQGTLLADGTTITDTQTIYVYNSLPNTANCTAENSFVVTIETVDVQDIPDPTVCGQYVLPDLPNGGGYYTATNGGGTHLNPGDIITSSQTIYIFDQTNTTPACTDEESFDITILPAPVIDMVPNVGSCGPYTLPALNNGNYYTVSGGGGQQLFAGQVITTSQTIYVYAESGGTPNCTSEHAFEVVINPAAPDDVFACGQYVLPQPEVGDYFTGPAGSGQQLPVGYVITSTQDVYNYVNLGPGVNCTDNNKFTVTITPVPVLDPVSDVAICDSYQLPALTTGNYYTGANGTGMQLAAGDFITETQTVYVYADTQGSPSNCPVEDSFLVTIYHTPIIDARSDVLACESYELDALISGQYFASPGGVDPLPEGFVVDTTMTVYIYAQSGTNPNCAAENSFLVEIFHTNPDDPDDVTGCDSYTLPPLTEGKYYANTGGPNLANPSANPEIPAGTVLTAPYNADIYVYSQTGGDRINCNSENSFHVRLYQTPVVDDSQGDVAQCSAFTLPALTTGTYYTQPNGPHGTGTPLAQGFQVTTPRTIYVYAASDPDGVCFDEHSFFVDVNIVNVPERADVTACGQYVLPALPASDGNYYTGQNGSGTMLNPGDIISATGPNTIYIYKEAGTTVVCSDESDFVVTIIQAPIPYTPDPVVVCAIDNDLGHGIFNLQNAMAQALNNQPNAAASIHETLIDAQFDNNPLSGNIADEINYLEYRNTNAFTQTLYIRLESTITDCYSIAQVQLIVNPRPVATEPAPYETCDNGTSDTDGIAIFDLTNLESEILGTLNPAQFTVTFFGTENAAENNVGAIAAPATYNSPSATIFGRVTNNATGCFDIVEVELIVNPLPVANNPTPYSLCDINAPGDEREVFDLTTKIPEIIGTQDGINVTFFKNYNEAVAGTGPSQIMNPETYTNSAAVEAIFVRVTFEATGCYRIVLLDVRVEPVPVLDLPTTDELTACDTTGLGFGVFDLQALIADMVDGAPSLQVTFHVTWQDAIDGNNPITGDLSNYHNVDAFTQILYVRVVNTVTGCTRLEPYVITLTVEPAPQAPNLDDLVQCDDQDSNGQNGQATFDLTAQDAVIHAALGTTPATLTIEYYVTQAAANDGFPRITNPATYNGTNGQTIWVRVETPGTECFSVTSFQLILDKPLALTTPTMLALCNEALPNDGITQFDLTVKDEEILGPFGIGQGMTVTYFEVDPRVNPAAVAIANPTTYTNPAPPAGNPKTLYVMVTTAEGCKSYTTLTIKVLPLPVPDTTPDALVQCDVNSSPDGMEVFDLTDAAADIRNGDATMVLTYYTTEQDAMDRINAIPDPTNFNTGSTTVWVRAEANTTNASDPVCFQIVQLEIIVNMLPELGTAGVIDPYAICELNTDGIATFDFNTHLDEILGTSVDPADYTVRFFANQANIPNGPAMPYIYTNTTSPNQQNIFVWVRNDVTGCTNFAPLTLLVEEAAIANPITTTFFECDYDGTNDGLFTFDLTVVEPEVLGTQNPATYSVAYYTSLADAADELNPIPNPAAFHSTEADYQMIWVRVTNESTVSRCNDITTLELFVERIPEPELTTDHTTVCINFDTNLPVREATIDSGLDATHTFVWYHDGTVMAGETGPTITVGEPGAYTVIATSATGCVSDPIGDLIIEKSGPASAIGDGYVIGNPFSDDQTITVLAQGYGEYQYSIDNGPWQNSNVFQNVSPYPVSDDQNGHIIHVRDIATADPCDDLNLILDLDGVSPIDFPNFFTPNGDGIHDTWQPFGLWNQPAVIYIFDRYGKLLKQISSSDESDGWDGTFNGKPVPADDYWFTIEYVIGAEKREFKGHFALKR